MLLFVIIGWGGGHFFFGGGGLGILGILFFKWENTALNCFIAFLSYSCFHHRFILHIYLMLENH